MANKSEMYSDQHWGFSFNASAYMVAGLAPIELNTSIAVEPAQQCVAF